MYDVDYLDEYSHSSLIQDSLAARRTIKRYRHNDMNILDRLLKQSSRYKRRIMVTDGLFSADGDYARISDIVQLCIKYGAISYVDDAHGVGVIGKRGSGVIEASDIAHGVDHVVGTMSKSFGSTGGFLALSAEGTKDLKFRVSSYTSSRSASPGVAVVSCRSIQIVDK